MTTLYDLDAANWRDIRIAMLTDYNRDPSCMNPGDIPAAGTYDPTATVDMFEDGYTFSIIDDHGNSRDISAFEATRLAALGMSRHVLCTPRS